MPKIDGAYAIVVAGGGGTRFGGDVPKQFINLGDMPVMFHSIVKFADSPLIDGIVLVAPPAYQNFCREWASKFGIGKITAIVTGGETRQASVFSGLTATPENCAIVLVHDGARPFVTAESISDVITKARKHSAATLAIQSTDTIKLSDGGIITQTMPRENLYMIQTPQAFCRHTLGNAHKAADGLAAYDDCHLVEKIGISPAIVQGGPKNIKITYDIDFIVAQTILKGGAV